MEIKAIGNRVLVERDAVVTETDGGIKLPAVAQKSPEGGTVRSVGDGVILPNGTRKSPGVFDGDHVLYTDSGYEQFMVGEDDSVGVSFIEGTHVFARSIDVYPVFKYNGYKIGFNHEALRDCVFVLPSEPPKTLGKKGIISLVESHRKKHHDKTGLILGVGPGYIHEKTGKFNPTDDRLTVGSLVKFDLSVPWSTYVKDTDGKAHYVCICGVTDIFGLIGTLSPDYIHFDARESPLVTL